MKVRTFDAKLDDFIKSLEKPTGTKVTRMYELLGTFGNLLPMPYAKKIADNLFELRIRGQQEVRIFYTFYEGEAVLLHGFVKKTQQIPQKEIRLAQTKLLSLRSN